MASDKSCSFFERTPANRFFSVTTSRNSERDKRRTVIVNFVDRAEVRVIERRHSFGFTLKAAEGWRVSGYGVGWKLKGDQPAQLYVFRFINHPHSAAAHLFDAAIVRDGMADRGGAVC